MSSPGAPPQSLRSQIRDFYRPHLDRLNDARGTVPGDHAGPFAPFVGRKYDAAFPRMMVVGKATNGWPEAGDADGIIGLSEQFLEDDYYPRHFYAGRPDPTERSNPGCTRPYRSRFWQRVYALHGMVAHGLGYQEVRTRDEHRADDCFDSIAWSNVYKVGAADGHGAGLPLPAMREWLSNNSVGWIQRELEILRPRVVVFSTGPWVDAELRRIFGDGCLSDPIQGGNVARVGGIPYGGIGFRTTHFQRLSNRDLKLLAREARGLLSA